MNKVDISIIAVGYKSEDTIVPFLDSIKKSRDGLKKEIIIVDNYPADKCANLAERHSLKPLVIRNGENIGLSKAVNMALDKVRGEYVLLMNPDTRIVGNSLKYLFNFAKSAKNVGAVAPRLLSDNGKIQPSCFKFPTIGNAIKHYFLNSKNSFNKYNAGDEPTVVDIAVMAAFMIPKKVIDEVGGLDERYFLYYEDFEYCRRLKKYGFSVYYYPKALVQHTHGASGSFTSHLASPLAKSAQIYHGKIGSALLNIVLFVGQKWQKLIRKIFGK